ncbi:non-ribosomal peptide synthetase [Facilibium subflavum]|uniref:non-ribosomal peptide synthetase n=1 Tax=Facilibium subflavum TaxID=2219058 RepID=UPI000E65A808|nr:non-ribosomal peptide synthetase [Facilibium subflavum]
MCIYPLTKQQEELWYAYKLNPFANNYNICMTYEAQGNLDQQKIESIYQAVGNYFDAFKTKFILSDGQIKQVILERFKGDVTYKVLYGYTKDQVLATLEEMRAIPFNLERDCLFRGEVLKTGNQQYYFQFVWHHIISDGLTTTLFSQIFEKLYNEGIGKLQQFKSYSLADYLHYEKETIAKEKNETVAYWNKHLEGCQQNDLAKYDHNGTTQVKRTRIDINPKALNQFLKKRKTTPFIFFNALIATFIFRCFHLTDIILSYPKNIRPSEFSKIVGYFVSMFPLRVQLLEGMTFNGLLYDIKEQYKKNKHYQMIAFEEIKKVLNFDFYPNISVVETCIVSDTLKLNGLMIKNLDMFYASHINKLYCAYDVKYKVCEIWYNTDYIPDSFIAYFKLLMNEVVINPNKQLQDYNLMLPHQKEKILYDWNQTDKPYPQDKSIAQLFEEQVTKTPDNIAVVSEEQQLTYTQLNAKANQLARYLRSSVTIKPDTLIALCLDKSVEMIVGILGILKSGGAYVPIDSNYPDERIHYILNDTKAICLLTQSDCVSQLKKLSSTTIIVLDNKCYEDVSTDNLTSQNSANNLAYVIYTSGTTGKPKGVMQTHSNVIRLFKATENQFCFDQLDIWLLYHDYCFDFSVWEIWGALFYGGKLVIPLKGQTTDMQKLYQLCVKYRITILNQTPLVFYHFLKMLSERIGRHQKLDLRYIIFGGDKLNFHKLDSWPDVAHKYKLNTNLVNMYGITETTVHATLKNIDLLACNQHISNIGKTLPDMKAYVLDQKDLLVPVPVGVIGELYIGGAGLAHGYLNNQKLTDEKFITNPFVTEKDKKNGYNRIYKTGDLVRWLPDGELEYIGRKDAQVKIRGFRIELSEIENTLAHIEGVEQALVINRCINDEQCLLAYYSANYPITSECILDKLAQKLPHYMVPSAVLQIDKIPLTTNGKIDIRALPEISLQSRKTYIAPRSEQERIICQAFSNILPFVRKVGINDDFFSLGGNSIKAIQLAIILQANFDISVTEIFDLRTPQELAKNRDITHDLLIYKLQKIKHHYHKNSYKSLDKASLIKKENYLAEVANIPKQNYTTKPIKNILLTGATGFLGCNLLNQLLTLTPYRVYLCIRAKNQIHAMKRMERKYQFYFNHSLEDGFSDRIVYIPCDLEKDQMDLSGPEYNSLVKKIDSIIHCAALAKHYGIEQVFYAANVKSTINLLNFCSLTRFKDFHYISTYSVMPGVTQNHNETVFTEDDQLDANGQWDSPYNKTKHLGELKTIEWRKKGINSNIYRVGNLAFMQRNGQVQEDVKDNSFANYVQFIAKLGCISEIIDKVEISPVDTTAKAIVKLFDKIELSNNTYHVFNSQSFFLSELFQLIGKNIRNISFDQFIDRIIKNLQNDSNSNLIGRFLLRMGWQQDKDNFMRKFELLILQKKTEKILYHLGFKWDSDNNFALKNYFLNVIGREQKCII